MRQPPEDIAHSMIGKAFAQTQQHALGAVLTLLGVKTGHVYQAVRQAVNITQREQQTNVFDHFLRAAAGRCNQWHTGHHRLQKDHTERLVVRAQGEYIERLEVATGVRHLPKKQHLRTNAQLQRKRLEVFFQAALAENHQLAVLGKIGQSLGKTAQQRGLILVGMQATDVGDNPGRCRQTQLCAGIFSGKLTALQLLDVDPVVQRLNALGRPLGQAAAHVVADRIGNTEYAQALAKQVGEQLATAPVVIAERMMHTDHRQLRRQQGDVHRLEAVRDAKAERARRGNFAQVTDGTQLQAANGTGAVFHEQHFVRAAVGDHVGVGGAGQKHRRHPIALAGEQAGVLPRAVQKRPVIAVTELQHVTISRACHKPRRPLLPPGCLP
ncbi:hypothetical protein ALP86_05525 [Pseudomonas amygdali pv. mori]|nr:hypothetical protein ALP86_05525 [Pseudomonas amygdali pv. mori]